LDFRATRRFIPYLRLDRNVTGGADGHRCRLFDDNCFFPVLVAAGAAASTDVKATTAKETGAHLQDGALNASKPPSDQYEHLAVRSRSPILRQVLLLTRETRRPGMPTHSSSSHEVAIIPFAPVPVSVRDDADQLDQAGQSILQLLDSAATVAEQNGRRTLNMAQKLSYHLHAAEDRIAELEAEAATYQQRAERAEQWLHRVHAEIEDRFLR
jgi:hypothetical protein